MYDDEKVVLKKHIYFFSKEHAQLSIQDYHVRVHHREYVVLRSLPDFWQIECKFAQEKGCQFKMRVAKHNTLSLWRVTSYQSDHSCLCNDLSIDHRNLNKKMIANALIPMVKTDPDFPVKVVIEIIKDKYNYQISYMKAYHGLRKSIELVYGTWQSSLEILPKYMKALKKSNPGTAVKYSFVNFSPEKKILRYSFWAFAPCIKAFKYCRKIICVDATHLYGKYDYKLCIATMLNADNKIIPLAFALVDGEMYYAWSWFLDLVVKKVIRNIRGVCVISDRHRSIEAAMAEIPAFDDRGGGCWRFCLRHVCSNVMSRFKDQKLKDLAWQAGSQNQIRKFNQKMAEINALSPECFQYLSGINKEQWTLAFDGGKRYGNLTTNITEGFNGVLKGARRLPITTIVQCTFYRCRQYFYDRALKVDQWKAENLPWPRAVFEHYNRADRKAQRHIVTKFSHVEQTASVKTYQHSSRGFNTQNLRLSDGHCTCGKWRVYDMPCSHAIAAMTRFGISAQLRMPSWATLQYYTATHAVSFQPLDDEREWENVPFIFIPDEQRLKPKRVGRDRTTRIRNEMDRAQTRARQQARRSQPSQATNELSSTSQ